MKTGFGLWSAQKPKARIKDELKEDKRKSADEGKEISDPKTSSAKRRAHASSCWSRCANILRYRQILSCIIRVGRGFITAADIKKFAENKPASHSKPRPNVRLPEAKTLEQEITQVKGTVQRYSADR